MFNNFVGQNNMQPQVSPEVCNLMSQPIQLPFGTQVPTPQVPCFIPMVQQFMPQIALALINEINAKAANNPARVLVFNLCSQSNYQNEFFVKAFSLAVDLTCLAVAQGNSDINQAISIAVNKAAVYTCIFFYTSSPYSQQLRSVCDYTFSQEANNVASSYANDENQIARLKNNTMSNMQQRPNNGFIGAPNNFPFNGFANGPASVGQMQNHGSVFVSGNTNNFTNNNNAVISKFDNVVEPVNYTNHQQPPKQKNIQVEVINNTTNIGSVNDEKEYDENYKWVYSPEMPLPPTFDPNKQKLVSKRYKLASQNGTMVDKTETIVIEKKGNSMNKEDHYIGAAASAVTAHVPVNYQTRAEYVKSTLETKPSFAVMQTKESPEAVLAMENISNNENFVAFTSLTDAINSAKILMKMQPEEKPAAVIGDYFLVKSFITRKDQESVLKDLSKSTTFASLAAKMNYYLSADHCVDTHDFIHQVDRYICFEVVNFLNGNYSFDVIQISSFIDDYKDIHTLIKSERGEDTLDVFLKNEANFIQTFFRYESDEELKDSFKSEVENVSLNNIFTYYKIAFIDVHSTELSLELVNKENGNGNLLIQANNPALYKFVENIFTNDSGGLNEFVAKVLICTNNDVIYEVRKHLGVSNFVQNYSISIFKR